MRRLALLAALLLPGCAVYPAYPPPPVVAYRPPPPPAVVYPAPAYAYPYRPWYGPGWRRW